MVVTGCLVFDQQHYVIWEGYLDWLDSFGVKLGLVLRIIRSCFFGSTFGVSKRSFLGDFPCIVLLNEMEEASWLNIYQRR